jgi:hypothetical protein
MNMFITNSFGQSSKINSLGTLNSSLSRYGTGAASPVRYYFTAAGGFSTSQPGASVFGYDGLEEPVQAGMGIGTYGNLMTGVIDVPVTHAASNRTVAHSGTLDHFQNEYTEFYGQFTGLAGSTIKAWNIVFNSQGQVAIGSSWVEVI